MDKRDILAGLDDVPWPDLACAYSEEELPRLLRTVASGSAEAEYALADLANALCHQGSVYPASEAAAPFLARMAAAGVRTLEVLEVLGSIAESGDERGLTAPGAARAAVAAQTGLLAPLLAHPDSGVRATAAWALTQGGARALVPLLHERWEAEAHPVVRATVLKALSELDPDLGGRLAAAVLADADAADAADGGELLVAARACLAAGQPWSDRLHAAATAWMADGDVLPHFWNGFDYDPFGDLILALAAGGDPAAAVRLVTTGLSYPGDGVAAPPGAGHVRAKAAWCARELARGYRSPVVALILPLAAAAAGADEEAGFTAISLLRELPREQLPEVGQPAVTDRLAAVAHVRGPDRRADEALIFLIEQGDPRAARLLARDLRDRPFALAAATRWRSSAPPSVPLPGDPALLEAVRAYLREPGPDGNTAAFLLSLVTSWGPAAAPAIPDVLGLQRRHPLNVANALTAIDPGHPAIVPILNRLAASGRSWQRIEAASRLRTLTGADEPLLAALTDGLREQGYQLRSVAEAIIRLGPAGASLGPAVSVALRAARDPVTESALADARVQLALALASLTGDPAAAIPVLAEVLDQDQQQEGGWPAASAADAAADIGALARPLAPAVVPLLDDLTHGPTAVRALLKIDPVSLGGVPLARLADVLVTAVGDPSSHGQDRAVAVLAELGPARLPAAAMVKLRELAERDQRLCRFGVIGNIIRDDEHLRSGLRQLLSELP